MTWLDTDHFVGGTLVHARLYQGMDREDLAEAAGIPFQRIVKFERGDAAPTKAEEQKLADALDVLPGFFYQVNENPPQPEDVHIHIRK